METSAARLDAVEGGAGAGALEARVHIQIEHQGQIGPIGAHHLLLQSGDQCLRRAAAGALIGPGGVEEAIADHPGAALQRAGARTAFDRIEARGGGFHERLRQGFLEIAAREPGRCVVIDASPAPDEVHEHLWQAVQARLGVTA